MGKRADVPKVNAGSMADIAFLLLIFFLVTTSIETDMGIDRMLPKMEKEPITASVREKNILRILINGEGSLMVEGDPLPLEALKQTTVDFLDNGGILAGDTGHCDYCMGKRKLESSDNPTKAIVSLSSHRNTTYEAYIAIQNELVAAYNTLRNREAQRLYGTDYTLLEHQYQNPNIPMTKKEGIKTMIKKIQELIPLKLSELETKN